MTWFHALSWFVGGAVLVNGVPHFVSGVQGRPFQTPFAKPPGKGLSSSTLNLVWGAINLALAYLFLVHVGRFDGQSPSHVGLAAAGGVLMGAILARKFGELHGGNKPTVRRRPDPLD